MWIGTKSLWARLSSGRRNCGRDYVISHGSGPTIFPAVDGLESLPDILQLCADGLHLFPVSACQVPETKFLSRNQPSPAKNISVSNSQMRLWQVDDEKNKNKQKKSFFYLFICLLHFSETLCQNRSGNQPWMMSQKALTPAPQDPTWRPIHFSEAPGN